MGVAETRSPVAVWGASARDRAFAPIPEYADEEEA